MGKKQNEIQKTGLGRALLSRFYRKKFLESFTEVSDIDAVVEQSLEPLPKLAAAASTTLISLELIERIIVFGFYYREMERFSGKCRDLSWIRSANANPLEKKEKGSVYRRALANGIVEILSVYRSAVLHIEQKLLSENMPILATVTQGLNKFLCLLPPLYELILEIERDDIRGGQLLNLLHKRCHCGVPELQTCMQRYAVLFTCSILGNVKMQVVSFPTM
ncbi:gamma-tubulin complex component 4 homolog [Glycine max]|uniref:gamma-tubulin complex component 4 homolog n=2 Tax=Glycine subgen. Soja TaxID=1462606 RepID=UPI001B355CD3|nr:gamma-tubulin complex component 4 homolog [Glycine max]